MMPIRYIFHVFLLMALAYQMGCSQTSLRDCGVNDWYEQGRIDGSKGYALGRREPQLKKCSDQDSDGASVGLYENGWNAGITQYCSPQNGFELGSSGRPYTKVCPSLLEKDFLANYEKGLKLLQLEHANAEIERVVAQLKSRHGRSPAATESDPEVSQQISQLMARKEANREEIQKIRQTVRMSL